MYVLKLKILCGLLKFAARKKKHDIWARKMMLRKMSMVWHI